MNEHAGRRASGWLAAALLLVTPGCLTTQVWHDDRSRSSELRVRLAAHRVPDLPGAFLVQLPANASAHLQTMLDFGGERSVWLRVLPHEHGRSVAAVLAAASSRRTGPAPRLSIETGAGDPVPRVTFVAWIDADDPLRDLDGVAMTASFVRKSWSLQVDCDVTELPDAPTDLRDSGCVVEVSHDARLDDGTPTLAKIAKTPVTLALDLLISPFEVWWYFRD